MSSFDPPAESVRAVVKLALAEDLGQLGDITSALVPSGDVTARLVARADGCLAGRACVTEVFRQVDPAIILKWNASDGDPVVSDQLLCRVSGPWASVLGAERTALNFLSHLSGIATEVARYVQTLADVGIDNARIRDTRKTTPGLRVLEKAAVRAGGGNNHRMGLFDQVMLKDNHLAHISITAGVKAARQRWPAITVQVECDHITQVVEALQAGADAILLDNMTPEQIRACVSSATGYNCVLEASGGITLNTVADYAATGVDFISVGRITNSAPALDIALDIT